jgi:hypothetical protein
MPIYFGCNAIENFFPKNSFIQLDPKDRHIQLFLKELVASKKWEENQEAIAQARSLILNEYQLFPFLYNQIKALEAIRGDSQNRHKETLSFKGNNQYFDNFPLRITLEKNYLKIKNKIVASTKFNP